MQASSKYVCTLKLIDETVCQGLARKSAPEYLAATIFGKNADELPQPTKVGSIIRIHRGQTKKYKEGMQLNCDIGIKGAWLLFDPLDGQTPIAQTGKKYTFTIADKARLNALRKFIKTYFAKHELAGLTLKEAEKKKPKDFDTVCLVLDIKQKDKCFKVKICDATKIAKLELPLARKGLVNPLDIIRLRSANYSDGKFKGLLLNEYSNILRIPKDYVSAKDLMKELKEGKVAAEIKSQVKLYTPNDEEVTKILKNHKQNKAVSLKKMFAEEVTKNSQKFFKTRVNVVEVGPKDPHEWLCVVDDKTKKQYKLEDVFKGKKAKLPEGMSYYHKLQLFVKDKSVKTDSNLYILFLCSVEGKGKELIPLPHGREQPTEEYFKQLNKIYKLLTRSWIELDLMVEVVEAADKQPVFFVVDTELSI